MRAFKGIFCDDISEFESFIPATQSGLTELGWKTLADIWRADSPTLADSWRRLTQSHRRQHLVWEPLQTEAPRLIKVAGATAISFALFDGAKRALHLANQQDVHDDVWQTALGYCGSAVSLTAVRVALLLDSDPKVISFQHIYSRLKRPDVVELLVHRACHASPLAEALDDRIADDVRASTSRFLKPAAVNGIDPFARGLPRKNVGFGAALCSQSAPHKA